MLLKQNGFYADYTLFMSIFSIQYSFIYLFAHLAFFCELVRGTSKHTQRCEFYEKRK